MANTKKCKVPCDELLLLASSLSIVIGKDKSPDELQLMAQFFSLVSSNLTTLSICKALNEGELSPPLVVS